MSSGLPRQTRTNPILSEQQVDLLKQEIMFCIIHRVSEKLPSQDLAAAGSLAKRGRESKVPVGSDMTCICSRHWGSLLP